MEEGQEQTESQGRWDKKEAGMFNCHLGAIWVTSVTMPPWPW